MTVSDENFPVSANEESALPSLDGVVDENMPIGEAEDHQHSPRETPIAAYEFGTTANEMRDGESLDGRLAREEPDVLTGDPYPGEATDPDVDRPAGRLVEPDEGGREDTVKESVARDVGRDRGLRSAEEAAMHIAEDVPGGSWSSGDYTTDND